MSAAAAILAMTIVQRSANRRARYVKTACARDKCEHSVLHHDDTIVGWLRNWPCKVEGCKCRRYL